MKDLNIVREELRKPLPKEAVKPHPTKNYLSTIKAIYVTERLNDVFGLSGWKTETNLIHWFEKETPKGKTEYTALLKTRISVPEYGISHECIASSTNEDFGDAAKGATTDAITKIGSYLEIGIDVFKGLKESSTPTEAPKPSKPETKKELPWLNEGTKDWDYVTGLLKKGERTIEQVEKEFRISKASKAKLI